MDRNDEETVSSRCVFEDSAANLIRAGQYTIW